jgi:RecA-family ATPase
MAAVATQTREAAKGILVKGYDYTDADGALLYQVCRFDPKDFRQRRPDGKGGWIWDAGERRVPYRLPELMQYPDATVFLSEGEKDADRIAGLGLCATTVASGKWTPECVQALAGREVLILEDNDEPGHKKALEAATLLHNTATTIRIVRLPGLPYGDDVSDWLDAGHNADHLIEACFAAPVWSPSEAPSQPDTAIAPTPSSSIAHTADLPPLRFINVLAWHDQPVPERDWCVLNRIPARNVTLFSGEGAIGKSIVSLQLAIATVLAKGWIGSLPSPGPALLVCCEDDADELHRRLSQILNHYGAAFTDLQDLHLISLAGQDALLATPDKSGLIKPTKLFELLNTAATDIRPRLIVLDNSADVFGGSENDRTQVRQFIGILRGLAISAGAGVLLTSHPSLTGISTGSGISGSTAWHASVRSRLYMKRALTEKDEEPDPDLRVIEVMKSNYGPVGETITVHWQDGVFVPVATMGTLDKLAAENAADDLFLRLLDRFEAQGRNVSHSRTANNYAPTAFTSDPEGRGKRKELLDAMNRLFAAGKIKSQTYGRASKQASRLVRRDP